MNHWKSYDDHINRSTQGHWHHTTHRIFPQTSESWQFGNCGPLVECHVLHLRGTIVMPAHARSWGAIDPALRPPLSSVPQRTMAGAFYPPPFSPTTSPTTTQVPQTTYAGQNVPLCIPNWHIRGIRRSFLSGLVRQIPLALCHALSVAPKNRTRSPPMLQPGWAAS